MTKITKNKEYINKEYDRIISIPVPEEHKAHALPPRGKKGHMSFKFDCELIEKIRDYAYWQRMTQQQVVAKALELFFNEQSIESRPEEEKHRPKPGRKPKAF
jgi:hypothetical protein